jgi:mutator protein MutT
MKEHVAMIIKNENNNFLFIKRSMKKKFLPGAWSFPSGTVEEGEHPEDTTKREAIEELGIEVKVKGTLAIKELPELSTKLIFVLCSIKNQEPLIKEPDEIDKIEFMKLHEFFEKFSDNEIGHGLIWLRKNPEIWKKCL